MTNTLIKPLVGLKWISSIVLLAGGVSLFCLQYHEPSRQWAHEVRHSKEYVQYVHNPKQEMLKVLDGMKPLKDQGFKVIYDGNEYEMGIAFTKAKLFILQNYKNEEVEDWVSKHLYRSEAKGEVIYLKAPDGKLTPLRDVFIEHWRSLAFPQALGTA